MPDSPGKFTCKEIRTGLRETKCDQKANSNGSGGEPEFGLGKQRKDGSFDANNGPDEHHNEKQKSDLRSVFMQTEAHRRHTIISFSDQNRFSLRRSTA